MKLTRFIVLMVLTGGALASVADAQSSRSGPVPAEFPPGSFRGTQYVDSAGCVFVRSGIDGNVTWVPRVTRQRRQVCGQTPSLSATARAEAAPVAPAPRVEQIAVAPPPAATPAPAPQPVPTTRAQPRVVTAPAPRPQPRPAATPRPAPAPVIVQAPPAAPAPEPAAPVATRAAAACQGASAISARYINSGSRFPVRCGPQQTVARATTAAAPVVTTAPVVRGVQTKPAARVHRVQAQPAPVVRQQAPRVITPRPTTRVTQNTRVLPRQVYDKRLQERGADVVPEGYAPVWTDDRLNPRRAEQSLGGIARSRLIWTNTVPRRLVDQTTGKDVTAEVALVYPYTDVSTQQRDLGTVTLVRRDGKLMKRIQRNRTKTRTQTAPPKPVAQTRAAPKPAPQVAAKGRYVQVGTFGVPSNAQQTAQRLARAGLPARIGTLTRGGKSYRVVLAGPFDTANALNSGLLAARSLGFADAFVR